MAPKRGPNKSSKTPHGGERGEIGNSGRVNDWKECGAISVLKLTLQDEGIGRPQKSIRRGA